MIRLGFVASIALFILKVCGVVALSWLVVAAPFLAALGINVVLFVVAFVVAVIAALVSP